MHFIFDNFKWFNSDLNDKRLENCNCKIEDRFMNYFYSLC